jgi:hypothetical protein
MISTGAHQGWYDLHRSTSGMISSPQEHIRDGMISTGAHQGWYDLHRSTSGMI